MFNQSAKKSEVGAAYMKKLEPGGKGWVERTHMCALEGISPFWDVEMLHGGITSRDGAAVLSLKPTGWRIPHDGIARPSQR
jgi:hypothetical protein